MTAFATADDLANRWRSLTPDEQTRATTLLDDAAEIIRAAYPDIDDRIAAATLSAAMPRTVSINMVRRVMVNPSGVRSQSIGPYSAAYDSVTTAGDLVLTAADRALLDAKPASTSAPVKSIRMRAGLGAPTLHEAEYARQQREGARLLDTLAGTDDGW